MAQYVMHLLLSTLFLLPHATAQTRTKNTTQGESTHTSRKPVIKRWYVFTGPDRDFVVEFPAKPKHEADSEAPSGTMRNFAFNIDSMLFLLSYVDLGLDPATTEGNQLPLDFRQSMLSHAKEQGWTVLRSQLLRKNVYEQETWSLTKSNPIRRLHYIERNIVRYGRQYILTCSSLLPEQKVSPEICRRFFDSFRVVREPQPQ
ncbi:MAG TPA: hypothetical protein VF791_18785 [Pyrinomonadaceae bacterium]